MFAVPLAGTAAAAYADEHGLGIFNWLDWPHWLEAAMTVIALDFAIWAQHVATHNLPLLWRVHQVHHADVDIDVTTAVRFHPLEIAVSVLWKMVCVLVLGPSVFAVVLFEIILDAGAIFLHANIAVAAPLDRALRRLIMTPDMHRVHDSVLRSEHDSDFGFNLSVWHRLFGTYLENPKKSHYTMTIGHQAYQADEPARLDWSLALPIKAAPRGSHDGYEPDFCPR